MGKKKKKLNKKGRFVKRVKETVGTESDGGYEWPDYTNMDWGMQW